MPVNVRAENVARAVVKKAEPRLARGHREGFVISQRIRTLFRREKRNIGDIHRRCVVHAVQQKRPVQRYGEVMLRDHGPSRRSALRRLAGAVCDRRQLCGICRKGVLDASEVRKR